MSRPKALHFAATTIYISLLAAIASAVCAALSVKLWAMFIGWNCFSLGAGSTARGASAFACLLGGIVLGMASVPAIEGLTPLMGAFALPVAVFLLVVIAMLSLLMPPFDSPSGYFLGMLAYYASGQAPGVAALISIGSAALIGAVIGWLSIVGPELARRMGLAGSAKIERAVGE